VPVWPKPRRVSSHKLRKSAATKGHRGLAVQQRPAAAGRPVWLFGGPRIEKGFIADEQQHQGRAKREISRPFHQRFWPKTLSLPHALVEHVQRHNISFPEEVLLQAVLRVRGPALTELVRRSADHGGRIDMSDSAGMQLLHHAAAQGRGELALFLLKRRADPTIRSRGGMTPLQYAVQYFQSTKHCARGFEDDEQALAHACLQMRRLIAASMDLQSHNKMASLRMRLSCAATELATFKSWGASISKDAVLRKAAIRHDIVEPYISKLWIGWPHAFLRLDDNPQEDSKKQNSFDAGFLQVRWRLLCNNSFSAWTQPSSCVDSRPRKVQSGVEYFWSGDNWKQARKHVDEISDGYDLEELQDILCTDTRSFEDEYCAHKERNRCNYTRPFRFGNVHARRVRRVAIPNGSSSRVSYSAKLARRGCPQSFKRFMQARRFQKGARSCAEWRKEVVEAEALAKSYSF